MHKVFWIFGNTLYLKVKFNKDHSFSLVVPLVFYRYTTRYHSLSLVVNHCYSLALVVIHSQPLALVMIRCHSLSLFAPLVFIRCTTRCHSLPLDLDVPPVCLYCIWYICVCIYIWVYLCLVYVIYFPLLSHFQQIQLLFCFFGVFLHILFSSNQKFSPRVLYSFCLTFCQFQPLLNILPISSVTKKTMHY